MPNASPKLDGRVRRGERNRERIVEALLALLEAGDAQPSARAIAERAEVSLRSVFQHFDDMEALYATCVQRQHERVAPLLTPLDTHAPFATRVDALVAQRARLYERIAPVRRATLLAAPSSPVLQRGLADTAAQHRAELAAQFAHELDGADRRERLAALELATCFDAWDHVRRSQGLSVAAAQRVVARLARAALREETA